MHLLTLALLGCMGLHAAGGCVRDGWPSFQDLESPLIGTRFEWWYHLKRYQYLAVAGILCLLGALLVQAQRPAGLLELGVFVGFWTDSRHAAGQGPDDSWTHTLVNLPNLICSGITSLIPLAVAADYLHGWDWHWLLLALAGLIKPPIWILAWNAGPQRLWSFLVPTRVAAISFFAFIGLLVALIPA